MLTEKLGKLRTMLVGAKLAGTAKTQGPFLDHTYQFRSNEQAADRAIEVVEEWLRGHTIKKLSLDVDDIQLVELVSKALWDAENEWRNHEVDNRDEYANKSYYQAEAVIEALDISRKSC